MIASDFSFRYDKNRIDSKNIYTGTKQRKEKTMPLDLNAIGYQIQSLRKLKGYTQNQLGDFVGGPFRQCPNGNGEYNIFKETKLNPHYNSIA